MSARETALLALLTRIEASIAARNPAPAVLRNDTNPQRIPAAGLLILRDGETLESQPIMSPLTYAIMHRAELEVMAPGATPAARSALLDALLTDVAAGLANNRTLGGAVEWCEPEAADFADVDFDGASSVRAARVPVMLFFTVAATPLS